MQDADRSPTALEYLRLFQQLYACLPLQLLVPTRPDVAHGSAEGLSGSNLGRLQLQRATAWVVSALVAAAAAMAAAAKAEADAEAAGGDG